MLNSYQLKFHSAELKTDGTTREAKNISYDEKRQRATLDFGERIQYSGEAVLTVKFEGTINNVRSEISTCALYNTNIDLGYGRILSIQVQAQR